MVAADAYRLQQSLDAAIQMIGALASQVDRLQERVQEFEERSARHHASYSKPVNANNSHNQII